jgi:hypothetical protein
MNAKFEVNSMTGYHQATIELDACRPEYQHSTQSGVGGISSSPLHLLRRTALVTSIAVVATIPLPRQDVDLISNGIEVSFVFPSSSDLIVEDEYSRIREEIVASGSPMLSDDEVRNEIRERKGVRGEIES